MRQLILIFVIISLVNNTFAQSQIIGEWLSEDKEGITTIYKNNGKYFGKITWLKT